MNDETFLARLAELDAQIQALPEASRPPLLALVAETRRRHEELKHSFARIHDSLGEWSLGMKYLLFDYEATRRERDDLRRRLGEAESPAPRGSQVKTESARDRPLPQREAQPARSRSRF